MFTHTLSVPPLDGQEDVPPSMFGLDSSKCFLMIAKKSVDDELGQGG